MKERATISALEPAVRLSERDRKRVTLGLTVGIFVSALEMTVVAAAMPTIVSHLGGLSLYSWVFSAFMLASTITLPLWGKLSDLYGRKTFYLLGLGLFLLGSMLAGQAQSMNQLIGFRVVQGLGAGALVPLGMTIAGEIFSLPERVQKQAVFSSAWGIASVLGPTVGGFITEHLSWRWVFYMGVPFGLAAALLVATALPTHRRTKARAKVDAAGALALTGASLCLLLLTSGRSFQASRLVSLNLMLAVSFLLSLALFLWLERKNPDPILPLELFRQRVIGLPMLMSFSTGMAMLGAIAFIPLFVQWALGASPSLAGSSLMPIFLGWVIASIVATRLTLRVGFRPVIIAGGMALVAGFLFLSQFSEPISFWKIVGSLALMGVGMGFCAIMILLLVQHSAPRGQLGSATASVIFLRSLGGAVGASVMGAVTNERLHWSWPLVDERIRAQLGRQVFEDVLSQPDILINGSHHLALSAEALEIFRQLLGQAIRGAFLVGLVMAVTASLASFFLPETLAARSTDRSAIAPKV